MSSTVTDLPQCWELELVPPRLVRLRVIGTVGGPDTEALFDRIEAHVSGEPYWLFEVDLSALEYGDAAARRMAADRIRALPEYSLAFYGAGFSQRMIATLFLKLSEMLDRGRDISNKFLADHASASAWLRAEEERREAKTTAKAN